MGYLSKVAFFALVIILAGIDYVRPGIVQASAHDDYAKEGTKTCLSCHDYSGESPVHPLLDGPHGNTENPLSPMAKKGCEQCHGPSAAHAEAPTSIQPHTSFGPKWSSSVETQNNACLSCHKNDTVHAWNLAVHGKENLTCVDCHDLHAENQKVLEEKTQADVCTVCHKVQKKGIHHSAEKLPQNPPCATCHNPHEDPSPVVMMLQNRSEGCRSCHDFRAMQKSLKVSDKAKQYHKAMAKKDKTCIDCHKSVAHVSPDAFPPAELGNVNESKIKLFYPGQSDIDWIQSEHSGAQSFRQGRNCLQCHSGDQEEMGNVLVKDNLLKNNPAKGNQPSVDAKIKFMKDNEQLVITISWKGTLNDNSVALMLGTEEADDFAKAGCWATCHSDMPDMTRDRNQNITKYLVSSRKQLRSVGRNAQVHDEPTLKQMIEDGSYVELWQAKLANGKLTNVESTRILDKRSADETASITASAAFSDGQWLVTFTKPLLGSGLAITENKIYTFGIAIHGAERSKAQHWVSLPMTFSLQNDANTEYADSDFVVK